MHQCLWSSSDERKCYLLRFNLLKTKTFHLCFQVQESALGALPSGQLAGHVRQSQLRCGHRLHEEGARGGGPAEATGLHRDRGEHQVGAGAAPPGHDAAQPHSTPHCQQQELSREDQEAVHCRNGNPDHWCRMHNLYLVLVYWDKKQMMKVEIHCSAAEDSETIWSTYFNYLSLKCITLGIIYYLFAVTITV